MEVATYRSGAALSAARVLIDRNAIFIVLILSGFLNGTLERIRLAIAEEGFALALVATFKISAIVWLSLFVSLQILCERTKHRLTNADRLVIFICALIYLFPAALAAWVALTMLSIWMIVSSQSLGKKGQATGGQEPAARSGKIIAAMSVPMFWGPLAISLVGTPILNMDAGIVALILGTEQVGNTVATSDGSGLLWIAPACSSLANISLTILWWTTLVSQRCDGSFLKGFHWAAIACLSVVAVNVAQISLIGFFPDHFETIHGAIGAMVVSWLDLGLILFFCGIGARNAA